MLVVVYLSWSRTEVKYGLWTIFISENELEFFQYIHYVGNDAYRRAYP